VVHKEVNAEKNQYDLQTAVSDTTSRCTEGKFTCTMCVSWEPPCVTVAYKLYMS